MPDKIKEVWDVVVSTPNTKDIFVDENDFRQMLTKDKKGVYDLLSQNTDLFIDESDFENVLGLKKNETQLPQQSKLPSKQPLPKGTDSFSGVWTPSQPSKSVSGLGGSTLTQDISQLNVNLWNSKPESKIIIQESQRPQPKVVGETKTPEDIILDQTFSVFPVVGQKLMSKPLQREFKQYLIDNPEEAQRLKAWNKYSNKELGEGNQFQVFDNFYKKRTQPIVERLQVLEGEGVRQLMDEAINATKSIDPIVDNIKKSKTKIDFFTNTLLEQKGYGDIVANAKKLKAQINSFDTNPLKKLTESIQDIEAQINQLAPNGEIARENEQQYGVLSAEYQKLFSQYNEIIGSEGYNNYIKSIDEYNQSINEQSNLVKELEGNKEYQKAKEEYNKNVAAYEAMKPQVEEYKKYSNEFNEYRTLSNALIDAKDNYDAVVRGAFPTVAGRKETQKEADALEKAGSWLSTAMKWGEVAQSLPKAFNNLAAGVGSVLSEIEDVIYKGNDKSMYTMGEKMADYYDGLNQFNTYVTPNIESIRKDNSFNWSGLGFESLQQFGNMAVMASMGATKPAIVGSGYLMSRNERDKEADEAGLKGLEKEAYINALSLIEGMSELVMPDSQLLTKNIRTMLLKDAVLAQTKGIKWFYGRVFTTILENMGKEVAEEYIVKLGEFMQKGAINLSNGRKVFELDDYKIIKDGQFNEKGAKEWMRTAMVAAPLAGISTSVSQRGVAKQELEAAQYEAAKNITQARIILDDLVDAGKITQERANENYKQIARYAAIQSIIPNDIPNRKAVEIVPILEENEKLKIMLDNVSEAFAPQIKGRIKTNIDKVQEILLRKETDGTIKDKKVTSEEEKLQNDLVNEELKNAGTSTIEQPIEGGTIQPITTPQADSGTIEEGVTQANLQTEIDEKAQTEKAEVSVLDSETTQTTDIDGGTPAKTEAPTVQVENVPLTNEGNKLETPENKGGDVSENAALGSVESTAKALEGAVRDKVKTPNDIPNTMGTYLQNLTDGSWLIRDGDKSKEWVDLVNNGIKEIENIFSVIPFSEKTKNILKEIKEKVANDNYDISKEVSELSEATKKQFYKGGEGWGVNEISEAYHKAKAKPENTRTEQEQELVKSVESLLSKEQPTSTTQSDIEAKKAEIEKLKKDKQEEIDNPLQKFKAAKTKDDLIKAGQDWIGVNPYDSADSPMSVRSALLTQGGFEKGKELFIGVFSKANEIREKQINAKYDEQIAQKQAELKAVESLLSKEQTPPALSEQETEPLPVEQTGTDVGGVTAPNVSPLEVESAANKKVAKAEQNIDKAAQWLKDKLKVEIPEGTKKAGVGQDEIIDLIAKAAKALAKGAIVTADHIKQVVNTLIDGGFIDKASEKELSKKALDFANAPETTQLTPEQKEKHNRQAKDLGWDNAPQAINSINKRLGTDYKSWELIPKHVKEYVSSFRNAVEKQKTDFNVALKAAYKYLDMAVKDGTITRDEADSLANMAAEKATPKTEKKGTLAEAVGATTEINQADLKNKKITMLKAMREKFNSFFKGVRAGKKDERTVRKIEQSVAAELRKEAKAYRDSLGINMNSVPNKSKLSMAARMATIRTVGDFMRFKEYVDNIAKKADFYEKVSAARKVAKKISKINPSKLTATDKEFIAKIEFLDAKYVSDIDEYVKILNEFYDAKNNPQKYASKDIKTRLSEYLAKEQEYVDGVKEAKRIEIEEAQAEDDRLLAETAIASGTYSGTVDEFIEDLQLSRKETIDSNAEEQEAIADARDKIREAKVSGDEVNEIAVKAFFRTIAPQIKDAFEQAGLLKEYAALKKWAESGTTEKNVLNSEQSALLGNILQNIDESQDFSGITVATGAIKLANKANDINSLNPTFRKLKDKRNYTPIGLATALSTSRELANKLQDMILTSWDSLIAKGRKFHAEKMGEFKRVMKAAGVNTFSQEMRIDTFAFINQWFTDLTLDEQVAHFQSRVAKRAQDAKYKFNESSKNVGERNRLDQRKSEEIIKALESFGLIEDVVFTDLGKGVREVDFKIVEGKTPTDIQNALTAGERKVYDHINGLFNSMQGKIKNSVITGTNQAWREITNYYPTFTESMNLTDDEVKSRLLFAGSMFNVSRTSGNAKARIDDISKIASERRTYKSGLFETMNTGLWENIIIAEMQTERNYVVSLFSDKSPMRGLLGDYDFKKTRDVLWSKYTEDLASFNIPKEETTIGSELAKAASNMMVGFILKNPTQLYKQIGGYFATMVHYPKESTMAFRLIQELHGSPQARMLVESMSTLGRDPVALQDIHSSDFPADYILNKKKRMTIKAIREMSSFADKFGDIIMPATKKIVPKAPQEFNSLMEYTDNINNNYIAWAGYIHALMKQKGLKDYASVRAEIFNQMASGSLDKELIQQAERWVETMNSASNKSNYPTILTTERLTYWMKSFSFITYNMYEENALAAKEATNQEEKDHFKRQAAMYRTQAIYFRVVSAITQQAAIEGLVYLVNSLMTDDDDEEKKKDVRYKLEAMGLGVVASLLMDLKFANKSVWADISAAVIANVIWLIYSANEKDKLSETDPDFDPNSYAKNITIEPKAGGAIMSALDFGKKTAEEAIKEYLVLKKAEVNIPTNIKETMFYIPAFATGSGTGRMVAAALDKPQDETIKKIGTLVSYGLRGQQVEDAIEILKDVKPEDVRKHIFALRMGKNLKSYVYIADKKFFDANIGNAYKQLGDLFPVLPYQTTRDKTKQQKANRIEVLGILKNQYLNLKPFEVDHFDPKFFKEMEEEQATQKNTNKGDED
jgi:hypothetical protein